MTKNTNRASLLHAIATEYGVAPEQVGVWAKGKRTEASIRAAVEAHTGTKPEATQPDPEPTEAYTPKDEGTDQQADAQEAADREADAPKAKAPKKPGLTLSQRRALLKLQDAGSTPVVASSAFRALPMEKLVELGYAEGDLTAGYTLTDAGIDRADTINPGYALWAAGETVAGDPKRNAAGTHRYAKAAAAAGYDGATVALPEAEATA